MKNEKQGIRVESSAGHPENLNIDKLAKRVDVLLFYKSLDSFAVTFNNMHSFCLNKEKTQEGQMEDFSRLNSFLHSEGGK
ncbi:hypothetical protein P9D28_09155 [Bacillus haynesii]|uniref:hypothetical protein n=1 Tax=Bacillus haynesii TaxID=1925021 RepID=UPI002DBA0714|nr:hypothetical protein [Bacillus haynesii]MEC1552594.1 hypothetical protein [Bacillus haynesii]